MTRLPLLRPFKRALYVDGIGLAGTVYLYLDAYFSRVPGEATAWHLRAGAAGLVVWIVLGGAGLWFSLHGLREAKAAVANPPQAGAFFRRQLQGWVWFARWLTALNAFLLVFSAVALGLLVAFRD